MRELIAQRVCQIGCAYEDGNDANALLRDPLFKLGLERQPLDAAMDLASAPNFSRLENGVSAHDLYRIAQAFVETFIASCLPKGATHGQQEFALLQSSLRHSLLLALFLLMISRESSSPRCYVLASTPPAQRTR